jgi:hypothetical protein
MKKILLISVMTCCSLTAYCQKGITFSVEELSKPENLLPTSSYSDICAKLILSDANMRPSQAKKDSINRYGIIARSEASDLVNIGYHSFFNGVYQAYADHRPLVLSPDMIWLLISQGFARHVSSDSEKMRKYFVDFQGKKTLEATAKGTIVWENIFPQFTKQIGEYTGKDLIDILSADFSTTTPVEKVASEITIMEAMKPYFEYVVFYVVCGIPEITLTGTAEDWQKILDKTKQLGKYDLEWWTKELEPVLTQFVKASKGDVNKEFWRNIFKQHTLKKYGNPKVIDGWFVTFFPYDKKGKRNNLKQLSGGDDLPEEIVKVDLKLVTIYEDETVTTTPLELWAGFFGLEQNQENFALTPKIGWMIREKDNAVQEQQVQKLESELKKTNGTISIRVGEIPEALFQLDSIGYLDITFTGKIIIPEQLTAVKIGRLKLSGEIDEPEEKRIRNMFPKSEVTITNLNNREPTPLLDVDDASTTTPVTPLIIIDGIEAIGNELKNLIPEDMESFKILKEDEATKLYGKRGKSGAIVVTLKKN